ncbi:MAG TPA: biotin--[acetyl-CoA-carboxylase] ligase, partial [Cellvibrionaceae bacterium]|nr:biotin--[acetyl-CoA-carboxylase] ligase [Cellvibrionaceae bacterium]
KPTFLEPSRQFFLNIVAGLAVADGITLVAGLNPMVKWPNDVLIADKKVCGILIENQIQGQKLGQSVVGIGLNVNQMNFEWPYATSMCLSAGRYFNRAEVFERVLERLDARFNDLQIGNVAMLSQDYLNKLYWKGAEHEFEAQGENFFGVIQGVDEIGRLRIDTKNGVRYFNFKEVRFIR